VRFLGVDGVHAAFWADGFGKPEGVIAGAAAYVRNLHARTQLEQTQQFARMLPGFAPRVFEQHCVLEPHLAVLAGASFLVADIVDAVLAIQIFLEQLVVAGAEFSEEELVLWIGEKARPVFLVRGQVVVKPLQGCVLAPVVFPRNDSVVDCAGLSGLATHDRNIRGLQGLVKQGRRLPAFGCDREGVAATDMHQRHRRVYRHQHRAQGLGRCNWRWRRW
jgi:hypothetical protein